MIKLIDILKEIKVNDPVLTSKKLFSIIRSYKISNENRRQYWDILKKYDPKVGSLGNPLSEDWAKKLSQQERNQLLQDFQKVFKK